MRTDKFSGLAQRIMGAACALALTASAPIFGATNSVTSSAPGEAVALSAAPVTSATIANRPGLLARLDGASPAEGALADPDLAAALSSSSEGLYEEVLPDGSIMVDLQGRFRSVAFATLTESGRVQVSHRPPAGSTPGPGRLLEPQVCWPLAFPAPEENHATP